MQITAKPPLSTASPSDASSLPGVPQRAQLGGGGLITSQAHASQSSLLLSSANVQADIDSDDLSFTDSDDEKDDEETTLPGNSLSYLSQKQVNPLPVSTIRPQSSLTSSPGSNIVGSNNLQKIDGQPSTSQLMTTLEQLLPQQKVLLTQHLIKSGALSIDEPPLPRPQSVVPPAVMTQPLSARSHADLTSRGAVSLHCPVSVHSVATAVQQPPHRSATPTIFMQTGSYSIPLMQSGSPTSLPLRHQTATELLGSSHVGLVRQQEGLGIVRGAGMLCQDHSLVFGPSHSIVHNQQSVPIVQAAGQQSNLVLGQQSLLPVASITPLQNANTLSPAAPLAGGSTCMLTPQLQPSVINQPLMCQTPILTASPVPASSVAPVSYMQSFLVDPSPQSLAGNQSVSSVQGVPSNNQSTHHFLPFLHSSVIAATTVSTRLAHQHPLTAIASSTSLVSPSTPSFPPPQRIIRVLVDKSARSDHLLITPGSTSALAPPKPVVRVMHVSRQVGLLPSANCVNKMQVHTHLPGHGQSAVSQLPSENIKHMFISVSAAQAATAASQTVPASVPLSSQSEEKLSSSLTSNTVIHRNLKPALLVRKRPAFPSYQALCSGPKRTTIVPVEKNGIIQGQFSGHVQPASLQHKMIRTVPVAGTVLDSAPAPGVRKDAEKLISPDRIVQITKEQANTTLAGIRRLLHKHRMGKKGRKQSLNLRKDPLSEAGASGISTASSMDGRPKGRPAGSTKKLLPDVAKGE